MYILGHFEHPPYNEDTMRSAYHTRSIETFRMKQLKLPLDIMISHDWPQGIYNFGDVDLLVRKKPHFKEQTEPGCRMPLGSPANAEVLYHTRPSYWFSGKLCSLCFCSRKGFSLKSDIVMQQKRTCMLNGSHL